MPSKRSATIGEHSKLAYIYGLFDPRTDELRYIGVTRRRLTERYRAHVCESIDRPHSRKQWWIFTLATLGLRPTVRVLAIIPEKGCFIAERWWIDSAFETVLNDEGWEDRKETLLKPIEKIWWSTRFPVYNAFLRHFKNRDFIHI